MSSSHSADERSEPQRQRPFFGPGLPPGTPFRPKPLVRQIATHRVCVPLPSWLTAAGLFCLLSLGHDCGHGVVTAGCWWCLLGGACDGGSSLTRTPNGNAYHSATSTPTARRPSPRLWWCRTGGCSRASPRRRLRRPETRCPRFPYHTGITPQAHSGASTAETAKHVSA